MDQLRTHSADGKRKIKGSVPVLQGTCFVHLVGALHCLVILIVFLMCLAMFYHFISVCHITTCKMDVESSVIMKEESDDPF